MVRVSCENLRKHVHKPCVKTQNYLMLAKVILIFITGFKTLNHWLQERNAVINGVFFRESTLPPSFRTVAVIHQKAQQSVLFVKLLCYTMRYLIRGMASQTRKTIVLYVIVCAHDNHSNRLSPSATCFDLYRSSSYLL
jgi:hypothetical protein